MTEASAHADLYIALVLPLFSLLWERDKMTYLLWLVVCALYAVSEDSFNYGAGIGNVQLASQEAVIIGVFLWWVFYKPISVVAGWFSWDKWIARVGLLSRGGM